MKVRVSKSSFKPISPPRCVCFSDLCMFVLQYCRVLLSVCVCVRVTVLCLGRVGACLGCVCHLCDILCILRFCDCICFVNLFVWIVCSCLFLWSYLRYIQVQGAVTGMCYEYMLACWGRRVGGGAGGSFGGPFGDSGRTSKGGTRPGPLPRSPGKPNIAERPGFSRVSLRAYQCP